MEAKVENQNGIFVVNLSGRLDFEKADQLKERCLKAFVSRDVIFNLRELNFVGSSGITPFLELLSELNKTNGRRFKICSVGVEFMRLFESATGPGEGIEIYRDVNDAHRAFQGDALGGYESLAIARLKPFGLKISIEE